MLPCFHQVKGSLRFLPLPGPGIVRAIVWNWLWGFSPVVTASGSSPEAVSAILMFCCPLVQLPSPSESTWSQHQGPGWARITQRLNGTLKPLALLFLTSDTLSPPGSTGSQPGGENGAAQRQGWNLWGRHPSSSTRKIWEAFFHGMAGPAASGSSWCLEYLKGLS